MVFLWTTVFWFLKKLKIELPFSKWILTIPVLSMCPKELKAGPQRDVCTTMLIAALFTESGTNPSVH
jgi:hypothetical protein